MYLKGFSVLITICVVFAQDITQQEENPREEGRDLTDYNQDWRVLDYSPSYDSSGWIPHPQPTETEAQPLKRRRIRKRKRRPPVYLEDSEEAATRTRPQRLDQIKEPWEEISDETYQKTNNRRRLTPIYHETEEVTERLPSYEKIRDPFTALQEAEEKQRKKVEENTTKTPDLKTLLKQSGGLSLSEVLQQKNLTLSELLKGNSQAISALAKETETTTEAITSTESVKYKRLPPSIGMKKDINRNSGDDLTSHEVMEAQRKRLALLHSHKDTKMFPDVIKVDVVTEETTERRLFVPSNPKFHTSVDYKLSTGIATSTETTTSTTMPSKARIRQLPLTSATLNKLTHVSSNNVATVPENAVSININEIFGLIDLDKRNETDGPLKMVIDLEGMMTARPDENDNTIQTEASPKGETTTMSISEKIKHVTAKEEIMEILKNPLERENLSRILRTRNMTVEELVQLRERGSSQLHLADIFHNKTREPEPDGEPFVGHIQAESFESVTVNRKGKTIPITPEVKTSPGPKEISTTKLPYTITSFPTYKIETNRDVKVQPFHHVWQQLHPHFFQDLYENNHYQDTPGLVHPIITTERINYDEFERVEEIENALAEAANGRLRVEVPQNVYQDDDEEELIKLPSGVKSAILASLAIIGLSLMVFLTILIIFKWTQKTKRLTYSGSFSGSKIRSPILETNQRRTFRTFVSETLGKKKNYYKAHIQSMSDSIWDKDEKKSYMI